jgi:hypothetical protein
MANKSQKNIKLYVDLTKSMLNEQLDTQDQEPAPEDAAQAADDAREDAAEREKLRKSTAANILKYLSKDEAANEKDLVSLINNVKNPEDFDNFQEKAIDILKIANTIVQKFGKRVLNFNNLSISSDFEDFERQVDDFIDQEEPEEIEPQNQEKKPGDFLKPKVIKSFLKKIRKDSKIPFSTQDLLNNLRTVLVGAQAPSGLEPLRVSENIKILDERTSSPYVVRLQDIHKAIMNSRLVDEEGKLSAKKIDPGDAWKISQQFASWLEKQRGANISVDSGQENTEDAENNSIQEQETNIKNIVKKALDNDKEAIKYLSNNIDQVEKFLKTQPSFTRAVKQVISRNRSLRRAPGEIQSKLASDISNGARSLQAKHLKNLEILSNRLEAAKLDPVKVFSFPANADVFAEMRIIYTILAIFEEFKIIGKNLEDIGDEKSQYLQIITPEKMMELYKTSREQFDKIVSTLIKGAFARKAAMGADIARAKAQRVGSFSAAATGKLSEILDSYERVLTEQKFKDITTSIPKSYEIFFQIKGILKEQLTIENETDSDLSEFMQVANNFYPYSKENLGFDKPVKLRLVSDMDNSKNTFGRTAYYDPSSMEIVIYTDNRHPKDMLRSFSHELVHHAQNCRGDFDREIETDEGYAQRDPYMREKEAEAYLIGNGFMVRDYEDSLKEKNKMLSEDKIREMVRAGLKKALFENEELEEGAKPDYLDLDKDGDKEESMKDAAADTKEDVDEAHCPGQRDDETLEEVDTVEEGEEVEEGDVMYEDTVDEADIDERRTTVDGQDAGSHGRGRDGDEGHERLEESKLTVEGRLQDKNDFLFEKLTKMWTK